MTAVSAPTRAQAPQVEELLTPSELSLSAIGQFAALIIKGKR